MKTSIFILIVVISFLSACSTPRGIGEPYNKETHEEICIHSRSECEIVLIRPKRPPCPVGECETFIGRSENYSPRTIEVYDEKGKSLLKSNRPWFIGRPKLKLHKLSDLEYQAIDNVVVYYKENGVKGVKKSERKL